LHQGTTFRQAVVTHENLGFSPALLAILEKATQRSELFPDEHFVRDGLEQGLKSLRGKFPIMSSLRDSICVKSYPALPCRATDCPVPSGLDLPEIPLHVGDVKHQLEGSWEVCPAGNGQASIP
jgi:hypothetical protein